MLGGPSSRRTALQSHPCSSVFAWPLLLLQALLEWMGGGMFWFMHYAVMTLGHCYGSKQLLRVSFSNNFY